MKNKRGRRKLPPGIGKEHVLSFRLASGDWQKLNKHAGKEKTRPAHWARQTLLGVLK